MENLTVNINGTEFKVKRDDDFYKISSSYGDLEIEAPQEGIDLLNELILIQKKVEGLKSISNKDKIKYILSLYANNPKFVTEVITDKTNGEDFSELSVKKTLKSIEKDKIDNIYSQLKMISS